MSLSRGYCPGCDDIVVTETRPPSHVLHFFVTLFTGGLWLPIWIILTLFPDANCRRCGCRTNKSFFWYMISRWLKYAAIGFGVVSFLTVAGFVVYVVLKRG